MNHSRCSSFPSLIVCRADRDFLGKKQGRRDSALGEIIPWVDLPLGNMTIYGLMFMQMALPTRPSRITELSRPINCRCFYSAPWPCGIWGPLRVSASDAAAGKRKRQKQSIAQLALLLTALPTPYPTVQLAHSDTMLTSGLCRCPGKKEWMLLQGFRVAGSISHIRTRTTFVHLVGFSAILRMQCSQLRWSRWRFKPPCTNFPSQLSSPFRRNQPICSSTNTSVGLRASRPFPRGEECIAQTTSSLFGKSEGGGGMTIVRWFLHTSETT